MNKKRYDDLKKKLLQEEIESIGGSISNSRDDKELCEGLTWIQGELRKWNGEIGKDAYSDLETIEWRRDYLTEELKMYFDILDDQISEGLDTSNLIEEIEVIQAWISDLDQDTKRIKKIRAKSSKSP